MFGKFRGFNRGFWVPALYAALSAASCGDDGERSGPPNGAPDSGMLGSGGTATAGTGGNAATGGAPDASAGTAGSGGDSPDASSGGAAGTAGGSDAGDGAAGTVGGGDGGPPDVVGKNGGRVSDPSGAITLIIAPGMLLGDTHFTFTPVSSVGTLSSPYVLVSGTAFQVDWSAPGFAPQATIGVRFPELAALQASELDETLASGDPPTSTAMSCRGVLDLSPNDNYGESRSLLICDFVATGSGSTTLGLVQYAPTTFPTITAEPEDVATAVGSSALFSVRAVGTAPLSYQWRREGADIPGATGATYTLNPVAAGDNGARFSVLVKNSLGQTASARASLTVTGCSGGCPCASYQTACSVSACTDLATDRDHCGNCTTACGWACASSSCATIAEVSAMGEHTCVLQQSGEVLCWGLGPAGTIGDGASVDRRRPTFVLGIHDAVQVSLGYHHACARRKSGSVLCWGGNDYGELGDGTVTNHPTPVPVLGLGDVAEIAVGAGATCARRELGSGAGLASEVLCWGSNDGGYLVGPPSSLQKTPKLVAGLSDVVSLTVGDGGHLCALRRTGQVACWGLNFFGQIGDGTTTHRAAPVAVVGLADAVEVKAGHYFTCARRATGQVVCWGARHVYAAGDGGANDIDLTPAPVPGVSDVVEIGLGWEHMCVRKSTGAVACWGSNFYGQLGVGDTALRSSSAPLTLAGIANAIELDSGDRHTCARTASGQLYCWGKNDYGQTGSGSGHAEFSPVRVVPPRTN